MKTRDDVIIHLNNKKNVSKLCLVELEKELKDKINRYGVMHTITLEAEKCYIRCKTRYELYAEIIADITPKRRGCNCHVLDACKHCSIVNNDCGDECGAHCVCWDCMY